MFHLCFLKYMIKLFFLSSLFIFVGILNHGKLYACCKHPDFFKRTPAFIVFSFDLQGYRQKKPFQALSTGIKIPSVAVSLPDFTF